jgi:molybdopterin converting factor subunit 1
MNVTVQLFARARELAAADHVEIELDAGASAGQLRRRLAEEYPALAGLLERSALAVNEEFAEEDAIVPADARVALLPPVSGG